MWLLNRLWASSGTSFRLKHVFTYMLVNANAPGCFSLYLRIVDSLCGRNHSYYQRYTNVWVLTRMANFISQELFNGLNVKKFAV